MSLAKIITTLVRHDVEFIIVGGMAGVLQGAPLHTLDLDIVYSRTEDNIGRLNAALQELAAVFRTDPRHIAPTESHLRSDGHKLLETNQGPLDVLGALDEGTGYAELLADSEVLEVSGESLRVLTLQRLIAIKEGLTRPKDQAALLVLRATLEERER
jgi:CHASE2 domain-containing sensor protein